MQPTGEPAKWIAVWTGWHHLESTGFRLIVSAVDQAARTRPSHLSLLARFTRFPSSPIRCRPQGDLGAPWWLEGSSALLLRNAIGSHRESPVDFAPLYHRGFCQRSCTVLRTRRLCPRV